jgi:hypothetical protein
VLQQLFVALGFFNGTLTDVNADSPDNKYLGRIIENVAVQIRGIEADLDQFAKDWKYE